MDADHALVLSKVEQALSEDSSSWGTRQQCRGCSKRDRAGTNPVGNPLFEALRSLRRELAAEAQVPPYVIFHDAVLREMAARRPASLAELAEVGGVGARKLEAYGDAFLAAIRRAD